MSDDLTARLRTILSLDPEAPAIEFEGRWTDWKSLNAIATGVERHLTAAGLGPGAAAGAAGAGLACSAAVCRWVGRDSPSAEAGR